MITIYFAVTADMIKKHGMDRSIPHGTHVKWTLSGSTILNGVVASTCGQLMDLIIQYNELGLDFGICKAIIEDKPSVEMIVAGLNGDVVSSVVEITDIWWVNKDKDIG